MSDHDLRGEAWRVAPSQYLAKRTPEFVVPATMIRSFPPMRPKAGSCRMPAPQAQSLFRACPTRAVAASRIWRRISGTTCRYG